jgi:hypothetical protein
VSEVVASSRAERRRVVDSGALAAGLVLSLLLHVVILLVPEWGIEWRRDAGSRIDVQRAAEGLHIVTIAPVRVDGIRSGLRAIEPERDRVPSAAQATTQAVANLDGVSSLMTSDLDANPGDARLWTMPRRTNPVTYDAGSARESVNSRLDAWNDSVVPLQKSARRAVDWTYTDSAGKRWGYEPGFVHLGGIRLPYTIEFENTAETAALLREWELARRHAAHAVGRQVLGERIKAMRERSEAERARKRGGAG